MIYQIPLLDLDEFWSIISDTSHLLNFAHSHHHHYLHFFDQHLWHIDQDIIVETSEIVVNIFTRQYGTQGP